MFIGREAELSALADVFEAKNPNITVVYGRRRVGKSSLIGQAARGYRFFAFEGLENQSTSAQKRVFLDQLKALGLSTTASKNSSWYEILINLEAVIDERETTVILLDELQWLANYRSDLISNIKLVWDQVLAKHGNVKLVLCGSVASFMMRKVIKSRALYGRCELSINLQPFKLKDTIKLFPDHSVEEALLAHLLVGGIPKYLALLSDKSSVMLSLAFHCKGLNAYFVGEYEKIFVSHFGNDSSYEQIVRYLSSRSFGASRLEICQHLSLANSGQLTELLDNLEYAGIIQSFVPFDKRSNSHIKRYILVDHFIRFYLTFLEPLKLQYEINRIDFLGQIFNTPKMASWLGLGFELLCFNHLEEIASALGFSAVRYQAGPYFRHSSHGKLSGVQIDLVFKRADLVYTVCEIKYRCTDSASEHGTKLDQAIAKITALKDKTIQKVLITGSTSKKVSADGLHFSKALTVENLF